ncbi:MAG TPA: Gfo/Idh/MocA family oxidoreductase [Gemmatales bacterium]|nr:Gfo/Idh/MocA family oxidoreductase [Gemmatales bacterium]
MNRRTFLATSLVSVPSASIWAAGIRLKHKNALGYNSAGKPMKAAVIGAGWFGMVNCRRMLQVAPEIAVTALADVDSKMLDNSAKQVVELGHKEPQKYRDYRKMLSDDKFDIVIVGSPDHWHALHTIAAVEAGADVYVEKPISHDIAEGQSMLAAARKLGKVVQVGTQRRSTPHVQAAREFIQSGKLGTIARVETCCYYHMRTKTTAPDCPPPEHLDFDLWTGPAPLVPYHPDIHPRAWRSYWEYGNGICGDMCVHWLDTARFILGLGQPKRVSSTGGIYVDKNSRANIADAQSAFFDYGDIKITWDYRSWGKPADEKYPWAATFIGEKGTLKLNLDGFEFFPLGGSPTKVEAERIISDTDSYPKTYNDPVALGNRGHWKNFLECVSNRGKPVADIEEGHQSTLACILANMSMKLGRELHWDAANGKVLHDDEANALLRRSYRTPWKHPAETYLHG